MCLQYSSYLAVCSGHISREISARLGMAVPTAEDTDMAAAAGDTMARVIPWDQVITKGKCPQAR